MSNAQNISRAQLALWHRRVLTEYASGSSPEKTLGVLKSMMSAQVDIDGTVADPVADIGFDKRTRKRKGA